MNIDTQERIEMLEEAQEKLREAVELLKAALEDTEYENYAKNYLIAQIETKIDAESEWITGDENIQAYIEKLRNPDTGFESSEEDDTEDALPVIGFDDEDPDNIDWFDVAHRDKSMDSPDVFGNGN
jgi:hypothetical protein